ncbi:recombinase family protein [Streptomyces sp. NPDC051662]|uniref:recombinase family protein n=1 Tax=Streptomyces sp. NPDC051662 TaxID=3154750 RepID=UPI00342F4152
MKPNTAATALVSDARQPTPLKEGVKTFAPARALTSRAGDVPPVVTRKPSRSKSGVTRETSASVRAELAFSLRLSRSSDESSSLDVQLRACRLKAEALGFDEETIAAAVANAYVDDGVSGGSALEARKKGMVRIMADRPAVVIAWKLDRFARSVREFQKLLDWADENSVRLVTSDSLLDSADKSGTGRLIATIIAAVAEWELGIITDRSEAAHEERRTQGRWISGKAPFPYKVERRDGKAYLAEDLDAFTLVREQIAKLLEGGKGATLAGTARALPIARAQWRKLLRGVMLRGWREHDGELVTEADGVTPVQFGPEVIDAATAKRIRDRLKELEAGERAERMDAPWLAGMVVCACGAKMNGGQSSRRKPLYKCSGGHGSIMADRVEPLVFADFRKEHGNTPLYEVTYSGGTDHSGELADLEAKIRRGNANLLLMDADDAADLRALVSELKATHARLSAEHAPEVTETWTLTNTLLWEAWDQATENQRRTMLANHRCKVTVHPAGHPGGRVVIDWEPVAHTGEVEYETAA